MVAPCPPPFLPLPPFSTSGQTKATAFRAVRQNFGEGAAYVAIGDGREEREAAAEMGWPFIQVRPPAGSACAWSALRPAAHRTAPTTPCAPACPLSTARPQISLVGGSRAQAQQLQEPGPPPGQRIQQVMAGDVVDQALRGVASHSH